MRLIISCAVMIAPVLTSLSLASPIPSNTKIVEDWNQYVRVVTYNPQGFECRSEPSHSKGRLIRKVYFKQAAYLIKRAAGWSKVKVDQQRCYLKTDVLGPIHTRPILCRVDEIQQPFTPLRKLVGSAYKTLKGNRKVVAGTFFPTFYQIAREELRPGGSNPSLVALRTATGALIAKVTPQFARAVRLQGTGRLKDGRVINVSVKKRGRWRYKVLQSGSYGHGIDDFELYPYRSLATDFAMLCERMGPTLCSDKKEIVGSLLYLPRLNGMKLPDGSVHDGFMCAVDIGGAIKQARIDLFVGYEGSGNPYYPECRRSNPFIRHGVDSLIPSDWRNFEPNRKGKLRPSDPLEYQKIAAKKALEVHVVVGVKCGKTIE